MTPKKYDLTKLDYVDATPEEALAEIQKVLQRIEGVRRSWAGQTHGRIQHALWQIDMLSGGDPIGREKEIERRRYENWLAQQPSHVGKK
jgi:hypothetical protein